MARQNDNDRDGKNIVFPKKVSQMVQQINTLLGKSNLQLYGSDRTSDIENLNSNFYDIMKGEVNRLTNSDTSDTTSFLAKLYSNDRIDSANSAARFTDAMNGLGGYGFGVGDSSTGAMSSFLDTVYQNKLIEQSDLHQVSTQLIELQEAILITRDAIITPDIVEGRINRSLHFGGDEVSDENYKAVVIKAEERFKLLEKIKNFIVPYALEYGTYYVYTIPYSKLFSDLVKNKRMILNGANQGLGRFGESVCLTESMKSSNETFQEFNDRLFLEYLNDENVERSKINDYAVTKELKGKFTNDLESIMNRIEICNDPSMAIPFIEEGINSVIEFGNQYMKEHGVDGFMSEADNHSSTLSKSKTKSENPFDTISKTGNVEGIYSNDGKQVDSKAEDFSDINDVYIRMLDPTKVIPVEVIDEPIGYYLVIAEETSRLNGLISDGLTYQGINGYGRSTTFIDEICEKIIRSFDKPFLLDNIKFKRLIVQAVNYYNLNNNRIRFQFIPAEYIQEFKVDVDENGHGQSMIRKSLFYAKMYLMMLMFKIFSIVKYSNDTHVNYVKQSGLRKDVANKVQDIIRRKQSRTVNMYDLYNYSTLINKIGAGSEMYIPVGRQGERPMETEILAGQDIQLNSDLLEMLKNAYILGTGVPAAIVNYLNEPEFAKVAEQNNSKWNARVVNYQLDFNPAITQWYRKILRWSTNIPGEVIDQFEFTLQTPKTITGSTRAEMFQQAEQISQSVVRLFMGDNIDQQDISNAAIIRELTISILEEQFPTLNVSHLKELYDEAVIKANARILRPDVRQGDNGEDLDLGDLEKEFQ